MSPAAGDYEALASDDEGDELDEGVAGDMAPEHEDDDEDAEPNDSKRPRR
jgi:hypothetical protein